MKRRHDARRLRLGLATITILMLVVLAILYFVVPRFEAIFADFGIDLPAMTIVVVKASHFVIQYWWVILPLAAAPIALLRFALGWLDRGRTKQGELDL